MWDLVKRGETSLKSAKTRGGLSKKGSLRNGRAEENMGGKGSRSEARGSRTGNCRLDRLWDCSLTNCLGFSCYPLEPLFRPPSRGHRGVEGFKWLSQ